MKPIEIKAHTIGDIIASGLRNKQVYESLSPEERAEVDAHNAHIIQGDVANLGDHPMKRFLERAAGDQKS